MKWLSPILSLLAAWSCFAGQVNWSSTSGEPHKNSSGQPLDGSYSFELGAFEAGFTPTPANTALWASKWRAADRATYNPVTQTFRGSYVIETNSAPFRTSDRGYIWGYSAPGQPKEWVLITKNDWTWPSVGGISFPVSWSVSQATAILGGVNISDPSSPESLIHVRTAAVTDGQPPKLRPSDWLALYFTPFELGIPEFSGWTADPDGDGKTNLDEMALNTHPKQAEQGGCPVVKVVTSGAERYLQIEFSKVPDRPVTYRAEVSSDLSFWASGAATLAVTNSLNRAVIRDQTPLGPLKRRYIRLTVQLQ